MDNKLTNKKKHWHLLTQEPIKKQWVKLPRLRIAESLQLIGWIMSAFNPDAGSSWIIFFFTNEASSLAPSFGSFYSFKIRSFRMSQKSSMEVVSIRKIHQPQELLATVFFFAAFFFTTCLWFFGGSARNQYGIISFNMDFSHSHVKAWSPNAATLGENGENRANNDTCSSHAPKEICFKKTSINHHVQLSTKNLKKKKKALSWHGNRNVHQFEEVRSIEKTWFSIANLSLRTESEK